MSVTYDRPTTLDRSTPLDQSQYPNYPSRSGRVRRVRAIDAPTEVIDRVTLPSPRSATAVLSAGDTVGIWNPAIAEARRRNGHPRDIGEQALDLPGEEPSRLRAKRGALVAMWAIALVVTMGYIGMPLTMFLTPLLGSSTSAMAVAAGVVVIGSLALRVILRAILTERRESTARHVAGVNR